MGRSEAEWRSHVRLHRLVPRRSAAEAGGDYLRRSAPVERFAELAEEFESWSKDYASKATSPGASRDKAHYDGRACAYGIAAREIRQILEANSGQRSAPKAESVAPDEGGSGAQARNAELSDGTVDKKL